jgi:hypothetical protein
MILAGIPISENQCIGDSLQYINSAFSTLSARLVVSTGTVAPTSTPLFVGQEYLDIATTKFYKASALTSSDWVILN